MCIQKLGKLPLQETKTLLLSLESGEYQSKVGFEEDEQILKIGLVHIQGIQGESENIRIFIKH